MSMSNQMSRIVRRLNSISVADTAVEESLQNQLNRIKFRTAAGLDANGFPFAKKRDGTPSRLYKTGRLMRSLTFKSNSVGNGVSSKIGVSGAARGYAPDVNRTRKFLGISVFDRVEMKTDLRNSVRQSFRRS